MELDEPPLDVNTRVIRALWHGAELDDLTNQIFTAMSGELAVLIFISKAERKLHYGVSSVRSRALCSRLVFANTSLCEHSHSTPTSHKAEHDIGYTSF